MLHVVLYQPLIPLNVGSVSRSCIGMNAQMHLVGPLAMDLSEKAVRRAGLDYWSNLKLTVHDTPQEFDNWLTSHAHLPYLVTKFGEHRYDQVTYADEEVLIFGAEQAGLPDSLTTRYADRRIYLPMTEQIRSYNLSNTVTAVLAQAMSSAGLYDAMQGGA